jgi:hypothetical protein
MGRIGHMGRIGPIGRIRPAQFRSLCIGKAAASCRAHAAVNSERHPVGTPNGPPSPAPLRRGFGLRERKSVAKPRRAVALRPCPVSATSCRYAALLQQTGPRSVLQHASPFPCLPPSSYVFSVRIHNQGGLDSAERAQMHPCGARRQKSCLWRDCRRRFGCARSAPVDRTFPEDRTTEALFRAFTCKGSHLTRMRPAAALRADPKRCRRAPAARGPLPPRSIWASSLRSSSRSAHTLNAYPP